MDKKALAAGIIVLAVFAAAFLFFKNPQKVEEFRESIGKGVLVKQEEEKTEEFTKEDFEKAEKIAQEAIENAPTYEFDGFDLKFVSFEKLDCQGCVEIVYSFKSRHAGYGNRQGKILAQKITPHEIRANIQGEKLLSLVTDRTFDEIRGIFLK